MSSLQIFGNLALNKYLHAKIIFIIYLETLRSKKEERIYIIASRINVGILNVVYLKYLGSIPIPIYEPHYNLITTVYFYTF